MTVSWVHYMMNLMAMLVIIAAAYYWYRASRIDLPGVADGDGAAVDDRRVIGALVEVTDISRRAAGYTALGAVLFVSAWIIGVYADFTP